jgi:hypothetical protein
MQEVQARKEELADIINQVVKHIDAKVQHDQ